MVNQSEDDWRRRQSLLDGRAPGQVDGEAGKTLSAVVSSRWEVFALASFCAMINNMAHGEAVSVDAGGGRKSLFMNHHVLEK